MKERQMKKKEEATDSDFFKLPHAVVDSGLLARMKPSEVKVYLVIARHAHYGTRNAFPSIQTICEESGMNKNVVCKGTQRLEYYGLIKKYQAPKGFKFKTVYQILIHPAINPVVIPHKVEKRSQRYQGTDGKFRATPQNMESDATPQNMELSTIPQNMESKEKELELSRDTLNNKQYKNAISKEVIETYRKMKGDNWVRKYMREHGYNLELINTEIKAE